MRHSSWLTARAAFSIGRSKPAFVPSASIDVRRISPAPRSALPALLEKFYAIADKYNINIPCFGHTGDGNVHTNVMVDGKDPEQVKIGYEAIREVFQATIDLGGTLSGEHGIGLAKAPYMSMAFTPEEMALFQSIKRAFDPNNILNPSKMGLE